jgi:hypothetical protein
MPPTKDDFDRTHHFWSERKGKPRECATGKRKIFDSELLFGKRNVQKTKRALMLAMAREHHLRLPFLARKN